MDELEYDVIVIGAGPVGENVADRVVRGGLTAVIIESELVGGECSYWACMPSKALLRPGDALRRARAVAGSAQAAAGRLDPADVFERRDSFTHDWHDDSQVQWLESAGIDLLRGRGRLVGERTVSLRPPDGASVTVRARHAVAVCTGSDAALPEVPGLVDALPWLSRGATSATEVPASLAVIGGGVVGTEMATLYSTLGSGVTVIAGRGLLPGLEPFAGEEVERALGEHGVKVLRRRAVRAGVDGDHKELTLDDGTTVRAEQILVAAGRAPRTHRLGLSALGVDGLHDGSWIPVDETLRVPGTDWLYGVGDVNHRALLTHQGKYQARAAGDAIVARAAGTRVDEGAWGAHAASADHDAVPQVIFSEPPVAAVGLTASRAAERGVRARVIDVDLGAVAGAATFADGYRGRARVVVDEEREVLVGATFVGPGVEEMVHAATIALVGEVPISRLWHAVPAYPTIGEAWLRWLEQYGRPVVR